MATIRDDLAMLELELPGFIGFDVLPAFPVGMKTGDLAYLELQEVQQQTPDTTRVLGDAPTSQVHGEKEYTWSASERSFRKKLDQESLSHQFGGDLDTAERQMALQVRRSLMANLETAVADAIMADTTNTAIDNTSGSIIEDIGEAIANIDDGEGEVCAVMSRSTKRKLLGLSEFQGLAGVANTGTAIAQLFNNDLLAQVLDVDRVLVGSNDFWGAGGTSDYSDMIAVMRAPNGQVAPAMQVQTGRVIVYRGDGAAGNPPLKMLTFESDEHHSYVVDGFLYYDVELFNAGLISRIENLGA